MWWNHIKTARLYEAALLNVILDQDDQHHLIACEFCQELSNFFIEQTEKDKTKSKDAA
jgi:hypothetical protein